jgi:cell pole-organizing protein PopZ
MEKDKTTISEELDHIKKSINQKNEIESDDNDFILLDKIVSKGKKYEEKSLIKDKLKNKAVHEKKNIVNQNKRIKKDIILNETKKNISNNTSNSLKKTKDPVEALVDREIKPIIKKWISKNLKSFVKTIVIQEMKLISKVTQKHKQ